jgi:hypothetical protein
MKKVMEFLTSKTGMFLLGGMCVAIFASLIVGLVLSAPIFWMGGTAYASSWMDSVAPYFFYPFFVYGALMLSVFSPYLWYIGTSQKYTGDGRGIMKGMSIFCSMFVCAPIYGLIAKALYIPSGLHTIVGILICGMLYLWIVKTILRKPFSVVQTFVPLC